MKEGITIGRTKVLLIDDNIGFCKVTKLALEELWSYQVFTATTGKQGITMARKHRPDVILLDIRMPTMTGGEVAAELMEDPLTRNIPIIFLTGLVKKTEVEEGEGYLSGYPFIAKPFRPEELAIRIQSVLAGE